MLTMWIAAAGCVLFGWWLRGVFGVRQHRTIGDVEMLERLYQLETPTVKRQAWGLGDPAKHRDWRNMPSSERNRLRAAGITRRGAA